MKNSILRIESKSNNSAGTGFVIDSEGKGIYILTCQHVIDDVKIPFVLGVEAKVISKASFIDMAVLYVETLNIEALSLQIDSCSSLEVEVIGFSNFSKLMSQKKNISASLYKKSIELHTNDSNDFYNVRKIKACDGFIFDRGNSGSPVICKSTNKVIAMVSNKDGYDIAYAINVEHIEKVWSAIPNILFKPKNIDTPRNSLTKDIFSFSFIISIFISIYYFFA